ncbi:hypothetical protein ACFXPW_20095 [Streptomyces goshikiensis]|uniref:hypothetical protein n=1 Tax=Streptomyces goshikiensis TaxID=1942 RepID=UPI003697A63C
MDRIAAPQEKIAVPPMPARARAASGRSVPGARALAGEATAVPEMDMGTTKTASRMTASGSGALIAAEERGPGADPSVIAGARPAQSRLAREREGLRFTGHGQIAEARAHYARLTLDVLARIGVIDAGEFERHRRPRRGRRAARCRWRLLRG